MLDAFITGAMLGCALGICIGMLVFLCLLRSRATRL